MISYLISRLELLPSAGQMYIYKLGTECDGAQTRASVVYIPTLVALLGLCFDPSECFWDLRIWSGVMGNKSSKLRYMSWIVTVLNHQSQLPKELLHGSLCPILLNMAGPKKLGLLTNHFQPVYS